MNEQENKRPIFIKATNVKGLVMKDNVSIGNADFAYLENVEGLDASGNVHITPSSTQPVKAWYEKPVGILVLGIAVSIIAGGILFKLGWV